jgi:hypothetical protein
MLSTVTALLPDELTDRFLRSIRKQFYSGSEKLFFQEQRMLLQAITWPARWLDDRGVRLNSERYQAILTTIIRTINQCGKLAAVRSPGRYLLHAVQEHMGHHDDEYYAAAKATRNAIDDVMAGLKPRTRAIRSDDNTVPALAEVHRVLSAAKPTRRKTVAAPLQPDFFAGATRLQPARDSALQGANHSETFVNSRQTAPKVLKSTPRDSVLRKSLIFNVNQPISA